MNINSIAQSATEAANITAPIPATQPTPLVTMQQVSEIISSSDLLSVIGRVDLMINIIGVFSTILFVFIGFLVWNNFKAKNKFDDEVRAIGEIRKNFESSYTSTSGLIKKFDGILATFEKTLTKSARNAKSLKEAAEDIKSIAEQTEAPAPQLQGIVEAQKAIKDNYNQLQTFAGTATNIRQAMQPTMNALKTYNEMYRSTLQVPFVAVDTQMKESVETLQKTLNSLSTFGTSKKPVKQKKKNEKNN